MTKFFVISFDLESTGLSVLHDQVVEVGAALCLWDQQAGTWTDLPSFAQYARPSVKTMCKKAEEVTGITMASLHDKPPLKSVLAAFLQHIEHVCADTTIPRLLLSYNGFAYDIPLLVAEIERYGDSAMTYFRQLRIECAVDVLKLGRTCLDTTQLHRKANGSCSYSLGDVYSALRQCPLQNAHGALVDSQAVLEIVQCTELCTALGTLLAGDRLGQNVMTVVRAVLARRAAGATPHRPKKGIQSKSIQSMFASQKRKKTLLG
jgi:DNA polymerase III epsilon subunit-like protein